MNLTRDSKWTFHWHKILPIALWPGVDSTSNRNKYQEHFLGDKGGRCVRLTTLPLSCAVVTKSGNLNFLEPSGPVQPCDGNANKRQHFWLGRCWVTTWRLGRDPSQHAFLGLLISYMKFAGSTYLVNYIRPILIPPRSLPIHYPVSRRYILCITGSVLN